jgi:hypothetical protein
MSLNLPIGISDFRELREKKLTYVDKSGLLIEMLDREAARGSFPFVCQAYRVWCWS